MMHSREPRYCRVEDGSVSVEALFWLVLVVIVMAVFVDGTEIFSAQGKMLRIVQDANRAYSTQLLDDMDGDGDIDTDDVAAYIKNRLSGISPTATVTIVDTGTRVASRVSAPASDFLVFGILPALSGTTLEVRAVHMLEPA